MITGQLQALTQRVSDLPIAQNEKSELLALVGTIQTAWNIRIQPIEPEFVLTETDREVLDVLAAGKPYPVSPGLLRSVKSKLSLHEIKQSLARLHLAGRCFMFHDRFGTSYGMPRYYCNKLPKKSERCA